MVLYTEVIGPPQVSPDAAPVEVEGAAAAAGTTSRAGSMEIDAGRAFG